MLLVAAALRFTGLGWGLAGRTSFHPDEDKILWQLERMKLSSLDLDPKDFGWGTLQTYLVGGTLFALDRIGVLGDDWRAALREGRRPYFARLFKTGRALSALFGVLTVAAVAATAWETGGARAAVLAASVLAVSPLHVLHSHYLTADVALGSWLAAAFWALPRSPALSGLLAGLAVATKPSALVFVPVVLASAGETRRRLQALSAIAVGFAVGEPYALLAFREWWSSNIAIASRIGAATPEAFAIGELLLRHGVQLLLYGLGPAAAVAALLGWGMGGRALAASSGALALTLALSRFPTARYALPLLPFMALAAGIALARLRRPVLAVALMLVLAPPVVYSLGTVALLREAHPYQHASLWVEANVPRGASVARLWAEYPPLDHGRYEVKMLADPFALRSRPYRALGEDVVILEDLPLHAWRPELLSDLRQNYGEAVSFGEERLLAEPWLPHDSRYTRPEVRVFRRKQPPKPPLPQALVR